MSLLSADEALTRILSGVRPTSTERVPLGEAAGRMLAEPLAARRTQPPFDAAAMDGYAVRSAEASAGARLRVVGVSAAGAGFRRSPAAGEAVRVFTGAPMPPACDAVLIQENAELVGEGLIRVRETVLRPGQHVRPEGLDFREGDQLLSPGRRLGQRELALAAAMNFGELPVRRRPAVMILSTGDELVPPGGEPGPDQIIGTNGVALAALVSQTGGIGLDLGIIRDDAAAIAAAIDAALARGADILVTSGGASAGDHDLVRAALARRNFALDFWKIAVRPGKPMIFGRLGDVRVLGLPGNPVSAMVCAVLFLRALVAALLGVARADPSEPAVLGSDMPAGGARQDYVRAVLTTRGDALPLATPLPVQDSSMLSVLAAADCLLVRPPHAPPARAGSPCRIIRLG